MHLAERLVEIGVTDVFAVPGGARAAAAAACPCQTHVATRRCAATARPASFVAPQTHTHARAPAHTLSLSRADFNLLLLDQLLAHKDLNLVWCCNELNAGARPAKRRRHLTRLPALPRF
jgi:hypothetical protein